MSDDVELADVPALFEHWLAGRPLAERSRREYTRNVRAFCAWLADTVGQPGSCGQPAGGAASNSSKYCRRRIRTSGGTE